MLKTYKIISLLLSYPNQEIYDFLPEVNFALKEEKCSILMKFKGLTLL